MLKVYGASKLKHAELWLKLADEWIDDNIHFIARWPRFHVGTTPDAPCYAKVAWQHDLEDVSQSDIVMVYAEPDDKLRGALVEAGMALASGIPVIVVGDHPDYGTWRYHPLVYIVDGLDEARVLLRAMSVRSLVN